jgi:hypothetical protein
MPNARRRINFRKYLKKMTADNGDQRQDSERNPSGPLPMSVDVPRPNSAEGGNEIKKIEEIYSRRVATWTMITGIGTVIAAILAGVAAWIFWNQLGTMQAQLTAQEADFRIDQRPILSITRNEAPSDHVDGPQYNADTKELFWNYTIKNVGKGTAVTTKTCGYMGILGGQLMANQNGAPLRGAQIVPTQTYWGTVWYSAPIGPDVWTTIKNTNSGIIAKIVLIYRDAYGTKYVVPNCLFRNANGSVNWNDCAAAPLLNLSVNTNQCEVESN